MVGIDALSQQTAAVKQLSDHHELPVCAIHSPCLLFTQRVWGTDPWGKLERSAEMAHAVGADVVVVHPPFRWQKEYAAGFVDGIAALEESTGLAFAVENMYPWRASARRGVEMYLPGWDPSDENYAQRDHRPLPRRHRPVLAGGDGASGSATRLRHVHLTDGSGSPKDEHLVPGRGAMDAAGLPRAPGRSALRRPHRPGDQHPQGRAPARSARPTCASRWSSPASTSAADPRRDSITRPVADTRATRAGRGHSCRRR